MTLLNTWRELAKLDKDFAVRLTSGIASPQHVILYLAESGALMLRGDDDSCSNLVGPLLEWLTARWPTQGARVAHIRDEGDGPWTASSHNWLTGWDTYISASGSTPTLALAALTLKLLQAEREAKP